jgi:superfamily II DNA or RNA helicase
VWQRAQETGTSQVIVTNVLTIDIDELSEREWRKLFHTLRYEADGVIYEPWKVDPRNGWVQIPRGAWNLIPDGIVYVDSRVFPKADKMKFMGELDPIDPKTGKLKFERQQEAVDSILAQEQGLVIRAPGTGKTQIVLAALCELATPSLVLVNTEDILQQWLTRIDEYVDANAVGIIRGNEFEIGQITVATVQTFSRRLQYDLTLAMKFGAVVLDEAHHAAASTFEVILNSMLAKYRIGVTATERRADNRHPYMKHVIGPVIHRLKFSSKVPVVVVPVKEGNFQYRMRGSWDWRNLLNTLVSDEGRNQAIARRVDGMIREGHSTLVLSREIQHLKNMMSFMEEDADILTGERTKAERIALLDAFRKGEIKCLFATQLADEALDVPILSCVVLTYPGKHDGRIIQQVGRALREHPGKRKAYILDVFDSKCSVLKRQELRRRQTYRKLGIPIRKRKVK